MYYSAVSELRPELQFRGVQTKIQRYTLLSQACKLLSQGYKQSVTPDYKTTDSGYIVLSHVQSYKTVQRYTSVKKNGIVSTVYNSLLCTKFLYTVEITKKRKSLHE